MHEGSDRGAGSKDWIEFPPGWPEFAAARERGLARAVGYAPTPGPPVVIRLVGPPTAPRRRQPRHRP